MQDLVDTHRANIARAGVALAEAIKTATDTYTAEVAMSEAALEVAMAARVAAFNGVRGDGVRGEAPAAGGSAAAQLELPLGGGE